MSTAERVPHYVYRPNGYQFVRIGRRTPGHACATERIHLVRRDRAHRIPDAVTLCGRRHETVRFWEPLYMFVAGVPSTNCCRHCAARVAG